LNRRFHVFALAPLLLGAGLAFAQAPAKKAPAAASAATSPPAIEAKATDILKACSARLAGAKSMTFTAIVSYESPSRLGPPLIYSTKSEVTMQRPDKLKVITLGDGPRSEFYYDGKTMTAYAPTENLVAVAAAPATIEATLAAAFESAQIYYPFEDLIVTDPYKDIADGLKNAFYIGQSDIVDNIKTDMVGYVTGNVFVQAWIGTDDKLPRRVYAVYLNDKARLRHVLALSDWKLDGVMGAETFVSTKASAATHIDFARPDATDAPGMKPPPKASKSKTPAAKTN
jgi:hypothetical protein